MNLFVENPQSGSIHRADDPGLVLSSRWNGNLLNDPVEQVWPESPERLLAWSGTLAEGLLDPHPPNWMGPGRTALDAVCDRVEPMLIERTRILCLQPHARHVLSDVPSLLSFSRRMAERPFEVVLSPITMLTTEMLDQLLDHLVRMFEVLGDRCAMILLSDFVADEGQELQERPLGQGVLPRDTVLDLLARFVPPEVPIVVQNTQLPEQRAWLGLSAGPESA